MGGVAKKRKGYHRASVNRVSRRGCWLRSVVVCYDSSVLHGLSVSLTMRIKALGNPPHASQFSRISFTLEFVSPIVSCVDYLE